MITKDKIKAVEKEERILKEVAKVFPKSKGLGKNGLYLYEEQKLREAIQLTLKSCEEEIEDLNFNLRDMTTERDAYKEMADNLHKKISKLDKEKLDIIEFYGDACFGEDNLRKEITKLKEELDKTELQKEFHWDRIKELEKQIADIIEFYGDACFGEDNLRKEITKLQKGLNKYSKLQEKRKEKEGKRVGV